jgi:hypothetical protein
MWWGRYPGGQDMVLEVKELSAATATKREWEMTLDMEGQRETTRRGEVCEIRLLFLGRYALSDSGAEHFCIVSGFIESTITMV